MSDIKQDIKELIISSLNLDDVKPDQIVDDAPLFQEGLGLDSIDALELAVASERKYRVTIPDEAGGKKGFSSGSAVPAYGSENRPPSGAGSVCWRRVGGGGGRGLRAGPGGTRGGAGVDHAAEAGEPDGQGFCANRAAPRRKDVADEVDPARGEERRREGDRLGQVFAQRQATR